MTTRRDNDRDASGTTPSHTSTTDRTTSRQSLIRAESYSSSRANSTAAGETDVKEFMKKRGLDAWHSHLTKHLGIKTCAQLRAITALDLRRMATAANMKLDQKTIDQVLAAIRRNVP